MSEQTCRAPVEPDGRYPNPCGLPIEGYGPCANCGLGKNSAYHLGDRCDYQPSQWRHVECMDPGCSMKRGPNCDYEGGHPATPVGETR